MADFDPPFGQDGDRRLPTNTEREQGFLCGPADRKLFSGLFNRVEAEIGEVITHAGIEQTDDRFTQLREAIEAMIAAATGGGTADDYILMTQARSRLPFFPDVLTTDGKIAVVSPETGKVRVPGGVTFQHRGIYRVTTTQTDFVTEASKTYHLRWTSSDGFTLNDLADGTYNPTTAAETDPAFDSTYDDMLVARVVTNSSNVPTVTNLVNLDRLSFKESYGQQLLFQPGWGTLADTKVSLAWARTPRVALVSLTGVRSQQTEPNGTKINPSNVGVLQSLMLRHPSSVTRYGFPDLEYNYDDSNSTHGWASYNLMAIG
jgi:hypothetical protein